MTLLRRVSSAPQVLEFFVLDNTQRKLLAVGVIGDAGKFSQRGVDVFGADADSFFFVTDERLGIDGHLELLLVGRSDDSISLDAVPKN